MNNIFNPQLVKNYITEHKLTIKEFCKKCGISVYAYRQYVNNDLNLLVSNVIKIANTLNVKFSEVFRT